MRRTRKLSPSLPGFDADAQPASAEEEVLEHESLDAHDEALRDALGHLEPVAEGGVVGVEAEGLVEPIGLHGAH